MKIARLAGLVLAAVMAISLVAASVASAEEPFFNPASGTLTALTGTAKLESSVGEIVCNKSSSPGTITNKDLIVTVLHFLECKGSETGKSKCTVKSVGGGEGLILTKTLHGILGLVLPHIPAILLLPTGGKEFVTLVGETAGCLEEIAVSGNVTGEISPIKSKQLTGKIAFGKEVGTHFISSLGGLTQAKLTLGSATAVETTSATIDYGQLTEVT
jgi:hypothetical protein